MPQPTAAPADWIPFCPAVSILEMQNAVLNRGWGNKNLVETGKVGELPGIIGKCTHEPVGVGLPDRIDEAVEEVQQAIPGEVSVKDIHSPIPSRCAFGVGSAGDAEKLGFETTTPLVEN
jgi:hypothetical protein